MCAFERERNGKTNKKSIDLLATTGEMIMFVLRTCLHTISHSIYFESFASMFLFPATNGIRWWIMLIKCVQMTAAHDISARIWFWTVETATGWTNERKKCRNLRHKECISFGCALTFRFASHKVVKGVRRTRNLLFLSLFAYNVERTSAKRETKKKMIRNWVFIWTCLLVGSSGR